MNGGGRPPKALAFPRHVSHRLWADFKGFIKRYGLIQKGSALLVAVSGGPDSVCLLHLLFLLSNRWGIRLGVAHFEHGLRGQESVADMEFVEALCRANAIEFFKGCSSDLKHLAQSGGNIQSEARRQRYDFFHEIKRQQGFDLIATGHTADDQAEELLFRLIRGSSLSGLSGIAVKRPDGVIRPILFLTRQRVMAHLSEAGIAWRTDRSNISDKYARNRIRMRLLPMIKKEFSPSFPETAVKTALLIKEDEVALDSWARAALDSALVSGPLEASEVSGMEEASHLHGQEGDKETRLRLETLSKLPPAVRRRIFKIVLKEHLGLSGARLLSDHLLRIDDICTSGQGRTYFLPGGLSARTEPGLLILGRQSSGTLGQWGKKGQPWSPFEISFRDISPKVSESPSDRAGQLRYALGRSGPFLVVSPGRFTPGDADKAPAASRAVFNRPIYVALNRLS
jgi:tRNA(Ile)-lysidine synthase